MTDQIKAVLGYRTNTYYMNGALQQPTDSKIFKDALQLAKLENTYRTIRRTKYKV